MEAMCAALVGERRPGGPNGNEALRKLVGQQWPEPMDLTAFPCEFALRASACKLESPWESFTFSFYPPIDLSHNTPSGEWILKRA